MANGRAVVAGAGIGGLTAAVALRRRGWDVTVAERAPASVIILCSIQASPSASSLPDIPLPDIPVPYNPAARSAASSSAIRVSASVSSASRVRA